VTIVIVIAIATHYDPSINVTEQTSICRRFKVTYRRYIL